MKKICVCIVLWHLREEFYRDLIKLDKNIDLYIISHKQSNQIPDWIRLNSRFNGFFYEQNIGYDWGGYEQFLKKGIYQNYQLCVFMHDDLLITNNEIFNFCYDISRVSDRLCIIGNGRNSNKRNWPETHIHCYAHSTWKPPRFDYLHDTVRGSFFCITNEVLNKMKHFEVFWDRRKLFGSGVGNWSLRANSGKIQSILGERNFIFLNDEYLFSPFLIEYVRGEPNGVYQKDNIFHIISLKLIFLISKLLMTEYMNSKNKYIKNKLSKIMCRIYSIL